MDEAFLIEMGKRIQERRKTLRLTQEELAERADITKQTVSRIENGQRDIGARNLFKVAKALDISPDYLLTGEFGNADIQILNQKITNLSHRQYGFLEDFIKNFVEMCKEGFI